MRPPAKPRRRKREVLVVSAEGGRLVSPPQPTRVWGRGELPQRSPGQSLGRKRILVYLKATERSFLHIGYMLKYLGQGRGLGGPVTLPLPQRRTAPVFYDSITSPVASAPLTTFHKHSVA